MARITVEEAEALVDQWEAQRDDQDRMPSAEYFRDASARDVIQMWKTHKSMDGKKLTNREFGCLVEAWCARFGDLPPFDDAVANPAASDKSKDREPLPADDTMLRMLDVERLTGITKSTIKRMVADGRFPRPMRLGVRAIGWPAADVSAFIKTLDEQRKRTRQ